MNIETNNSTNWDWLIGYPLEEATEILIEEGTSHKLQFTAAPGKQSTTEDAFVIAVRNNNLLSQELPLVLICATTDWSVN